MGFLEGLSKFVKYASEQQERRREQEERNFIRSVRRDIDRIEQWERDVDRDYDEWEKRHARRRR